MEKWVIGIDEAGRGPLAGPVAVGVALVPRDFDWEQLPGVTDSKLLSEDKRERIFQAARRLKAAAQLDYAVSMVSAPVIDRGGIVVAINLAMNRALRRIEKFPRFPRSDLKKFLRSDLGNRYASTNIMVKLDGGLKAPERFLNQETIIKGDQKESVIGLASIMAKVTRDRYMVRKAAEPLFAPYTFHLHKGYGTKAHREVIAKCGLSAIHRHSYCKNIKML